jgi:hypothetical protein
MHFGKIADIITALYQSTLYRKNCSSCNYIHQATAWIRKPPNKIARNPPIRKKECEKLRAHDIKRLKLVRPIIPKTDAATIEIHPKIKIAVGYLDSVAYIIKATPKMTLTTTAKICRLNDSNFLRSRPNIVSGLIIIIIPATIVAVANSIII